MNRIILIASLLSLTTLTGCFGTFTARTVTEKPVPVACQEKVADRPATPTDAFKVKPTTDQLLKAQDAEIVLRQAYEVQLRTALVICTTPIKP
jgi:hypothetical protein